jgi:hypothetical protein
MVIELRHPAIEPAISSRNQASCPLPMANDDSLRRMAANMNIELAFVKKATAVFTV